MSETLTPPIAFPPVPAEPAADPPLEQYAPLFKLSVERYHEMIATGLFDDEDGRVELLEGVLVNKMPKDPIHSAVTGVLQDLLPPMLPPGYCVRLGEPVTTNDSEPEPDVTVARGIRADFFNRHPTPAESVLIVEVANSSLRRDRKLKRRVYANAGCANYWIVSTIDQTVEVYRDPKPGTGYAEPQTYCRGERVPVVLDGRAVGEIAVDDLFPRLG